MKKGIVGSSVVVLVLLFGQLHFALAEEEQKSMVSPAKMEPALSQLKTDLNVGFQELELTVDDTGKLLYRGIKRTDDGEAVSEKSFLLSDIDADSVTTTGNNILSFACKNHQSCINFSRSENFKSQRGYERKIALRGDKFPIVSSDPAVANKTKQAFQQLISLFSTTDK